jgi:hypothetical protein
MKTAFFLTLIVAVLFTSCKSSNSRETFVPGVIPYHIEIEKNIQNVESLPLSKIGKELDYIVLETTPNSILQDIINIAFCDSFIFVYDGGKLLQFNNKGRFIRQVGSNGRGPTELISLIDFCIDEKDKNIFLINYGANNILVFDFNGQFVRSFRSPDSQISQIILKDTNSLMFHLPNNPVKSPGTIDNYNWYITDKHGSNLMKIRNYLIRTSKDGLNTFFGTMYLFNDSVRFREFGRDTLYHFNNSKKEPYAIFNLGKMKMDPDPDYKGASREEIKKRLEQKIWIYHFITEDKKYLFFTFKWGYTNVSSYCIYDKQTSEVSILKDNGFINDLDGGILFFPRYIFNDSIHVDYIDSFKLLGLINKTFSDKLKELDVNKIDQFEKLKNQLTETSNPVLMILK